MVSRGERLLELGSSGSYGRAASGGSFHDHRCIGAWVATTGGISNTEPGIEVRREYRAVEGAASTPITAQTPAV
jgi:hypothetical protein